MKQVIYNGGTQSYYGCSDPAVLVIGQVYEVVHEEDRGWQTDYTTLSQKISPLLGNVTKSRSTMIPTIIWKIGLPAQFSPQN